MDQIKTKFLKVDETDDLEAPILRVNITNTEEIIDQSTSIRIKSEFLIPELPETDKDRSSKGVVFMVPPVLTVRQFAYQERIPISIDEIRRRISPPESLSQPVVLNLLRLNRDKAKQLKKALNQFGIKELPGRSAVVSSFTRLSEAEARNLAEDYFFLASKYMKLKQMNQAITSRHGGQKPFMPRAEATRKLLESILSEIEKRNSNLNLLTHGFSSLILPAVFDILIEILSYREKESSDTSFIVNKLSS